MPHLLALLLTCLIFFSSAAVPAAEIEVNTFDDEVSDNGLCSLREAVIAANTDLVVDTCLAGEAGNDTILLFQIGIYQLSIAGALEDAGLTGDLDISSQVTIVGINPKLITIDGAELDSIFNVHASGQLFLSSITLANGRGVGGAIAVSTGGLVYVQGTNFEDNFSVAAGGAIRNDTGIVFVIGSTFNNNTATGYGGAISSFGVGSELSVLNSTVSGNFVQSTGFGAGIETIDSNVLIKNTTITDNTALGSATAGGLSVGNGATVLLSHTIVAGNSIVTGASLDCFIDGTGVVTSLGHNLIGDNSGCNFTSATGDLVGTSVTPIDPQLAALDYNFGLLKTHLLLSTSPAVDAGSAVADSSDNTACEEFDANGIARPRDGNGDSIGVCDIGATEYIEAQTLSFISVAADDGFIREAGEATALGGIAKKRGAIRVGDNLLNREEYGLLSFNTASLPDAAVIISANVELRRSKIVGSDPADTHGNIFLAIKNGFFGSALRLQAEDFSATGDDSSAGLLLPKLGVVNTFESELSVGAQSLISNSATTQFRLNFDSGDDADFIADAYVFSSGNHRSVARRPKLEVTYYLP